MLDPEAREEEYSNVGNFGKPKEPLLALTQFLRAFDVKPLDGWKSRTNATMNGVYQFFYLENIIGQSPLRSETVFNFFSSDFIPADSHFISNSMVAPEFQIQSDTVLIKFHNLIRSSLNTNEKNAILENNASLKNFASARSYTKQNYYINVDIELQIFENALDGDTNGDFNNINLPFLKTDIPAEVQKLEESMGHVFRKALYDPSYSLLFLGFFSCGFQLGFITAHFPAFITEMCSAIPQNSILRSMGVSSVSSLGAFSIALIGSANIIGAIAAGALGKHFPIKHLLW